MSPAEEVVAGAELGVVTVAEAFGVVEVAVGLGVVLEAVAEGELLVDVLGAGLVTLGELETLGTPTGVMGADEDDENVRSTQYWLACQVLVGKLEVVP